MKNLTSKLIFLLVIQVLLVAAFFLSGQQTQNYTQQDLFDLASQNFDKIIIKEQDKAITLTLQDKGWVLADVNNLPVASTKIADIIDKLKSLKTSWPIATTKTSHERFEVADNKFQRQLMLYKNDNLISELYLGTSPGFRKVHARLKGKDQVFSLTLNHFDFSTDVNQWLDKSLLASNELSRIKGVDFELVKTADKWSLANSSQAADDNLSINEIKAQELASALTGLTVQKIADKIPLSTPVSIEISTANQTFHYDFFNDEENYIIRRNDVSEVFIISQSDYEKLTQFERANLTLVAEKSEAKQSDESLSVEKHSTEEANFDTTTSDNS